MKPVKTLLVVSLLASLTACVSTFTPESTVSSAKDALESDDVETFQSLLVGDASIQFKSVESVKELKASLSRFQNLEVGQAKLVDEQKLSDDEIRTKHVVKVLGNGVPALEVSVICVNHYGFSGREPSSEDARSFGLASLWDSGDEAREIGREGRLDRPRREWNNICRIAAVK